MKTHCPFCQSQRVQYSESPTKPDTSYLSPEYLAALGASAAKALNMPPVIGGVVGAAIGGLASVLLENKPLLTQQQPQGYCLDCHRWFN